MNSSITLATTEKVNLEELEVLLTELEKFRKRHAGPRKFYFKFRKLINFVLTTGLITLVVSIIFAPLFALTWPFLIGWGVLVILDTIISGRLNKRRDEFYVRFKTEVMPQAIKHVNPGYTYKADGAIKKLLFDKAMLIPQKAEFYFGEDLIKGSVGKVDFKCCEIRVNKSQYSAKKIAGNTAMGCLGFIFSLFMGDPEVSVGEGNNKKIVRLFSGLFLAADFHKSFKGSVLLRPKNQGVKQILSDHLEKAEMGDVDFDNRYSVYTTNQTLARYILSPFLIQQIVKLDAVSPGPLLLTFREGYMFLGLPQEKDLFDCSFYEGVPDLKAFEDFVKEVRIIEKVLEHLNQNTRIWGDKAMD